MSLKAQDVVVLLKVALHGEESWTFASLAGELALSVSEVHAATHRLMGAGLLHPERRTAIRASLVEFLIHGVKFAFPAVRGPVTRGLPTAYAAPPLSQVIRGGGDLPPVWPDPEGRTRGEEFAPLYPSVPRAARKDERLYAALALLDAIRGGRARERVLAEKLLMEMLNV